MLLVLAATAIVTLALTADLFAPRAHEAWERHRARRQRPPSPLYDPGRDLRAEHKARLLLRSCVEEEEWAMYRDLGFIRVWGSLADGPEPRARLRGVTAARNRAGGVPYAYLIYPHKPIVAYLPQTHRLLSEYCVTFPDTTRPYGSTRLPDSDDVLAKWMALTGDERRLIETANMHLPGRQHDPDQVLRDLWRLTQWERQRMRANAQLAAGDAAPPPRRRADAAS